jgi:hypothetical protein
MFPVPTPIFHITAIDNLASIAKAGALFSKRSAATQGLNSASIAYEQIQGRRAVTGSSQSAVYRPLNDRG